MHCLLLTQLGVSQLRNSWLASSDTREGWTQEWGGAGGTSWLVHRASWGEREISGCISSVELPLGLAFVVDSWVPVSLGGLLALPASGPLWPMVVMPVRAREGSTGPAASCSQLTTFFKKTHLLCSLNLQVCSRMFFTIYSLWSSVQVCAVLLWLISQCSVLSPMYSSGV